MHRFIHELMNVCTLAGVKPEADRSLFDLRRDTAEAIARVMVEHCAASRAEGIARAILREVKRQKQAHAG